MKALVMIFLFPALMYSQSNQYFTLQTEVDARNLFVGGTVNETGYNGVFKAGFSTDWFRTDVFYETFALLNYQTAGVNLTYLHNYRKDFKQGVGIQISLIEKPRRFTPSLGLNALLEYHFSSFFISARLERKLRTDWDITVNSGFVGIGIKL